MSHPISPKMMAQQQQGNLQLTIVCYPVPSQMGFNTYVRSPQPSTLMAPSPQQRTLPPVSQ